jgi:hypothetical protein
MGNDLMRVPHMIYLGSSCHNIYAAAEKGDGLRYSVLQIVVLISFRRYHYLINDEVVRA